MSGTRAPVVDLNADAGEGFDDAALLPYVSSCSIACGAHAGDERTMREAVALALRLGVAVGAHPGFPDREGFGREVTTRDCAAIAALVRAQVEALAAIAEREGAHLRHVKPHGALYNLAAANRRVADAVAAAVVAIDRTLLVYALAGSVAIEASRAAGLRPVAEGFADRGYRADGSLVPRGTPGALLTDDGEVAARAVRIVREGRIECVDGVPAELAVETLCIHGDTPGSAVIARRVRAALAAAGVAVRAPA